MLVFRAIGNVVVRFLLSQNTRSYNGRKSSQQTDFHRIFQEILQNMQNGYSNQTNRSSQSSSSYSTNRSGITRKEAFEILGLQQNATDEEIRTAYKKLIMKNHPDSGGSNYLSQKITEAKNLLLGEK
jgi:DnaJ-domain-containing protein 1